MDTLGDLAQQGAGDGLVGGEVLEVDGDEKLLSLLVDIANIDTTLVGKENPVTLDRDVSGGGTGCDWQRQCDSRAPAQEPQD